MKFVLLYYFKSLKKNLFRDIRNAFILSLILSIVLLFSVTPSLDNDNQKRFLENSGYMFISMSESIKADKNSYQLYFTNAYSHVTTTLDESIGGVLADRASYLELYIELENTTYDKTSPFNKKNLFKSSKNDYGELGIGLTYNTLSLLNIWLDDDVYIDLVLKRNEEIVILSKKYKVQNVYKPKFGDLENKSINESCGLGIISQTIITTELQGWTIASFLTESLDEFKDCDNVTKQFQYSIIKTNDIFYSISISSGFFIMGFLLILLIYLRDINYNINKRKKNIAILSMAGAEKKSLIWIFLFNSIVVFLVSSLLSAVLYKFVLARFILKNYVAEPIFLMSLAVCLVIGTILIVISYFRIKFKLSKIDEIHVVNSKEGIL